MTKTHDSSRRRFLGGASAGAVAGMVASVPLRAAAPPANWDKETDVVVVGGGGSGCMAAVSANEQGAKAIIVEAAPVIGGASVMCIGAVTVPLSSLQKKEGIADSVDAYMEDVLKLAGENVSRMDKSLLRVLGENGGPTIDWLLGLGVDLRGPFEYPVHRVKRMHMLYPRSSAWPRVIRPRLAKGGTETLVSTKGVELYRGEGNRVLGVRVVAIKSGKSISIKARRGVVLTAGNFEANPTMMAKVTTADIAALPVAVPTNDGGGLIMAAALGAGMTMLDNGAIPYVRGRLPGPPVDPTAKMQWMPFGFVEAGAILVNQNGARFINEEMHGTPTCLALESQPEKTCHLVYDKRIADNFQKWPNIAALIPGIGDISRLGGWGTVDDLIARKAVYKADTIEQLAAVVGVDPAGLKAGIEKWNGYCSAGNDPEFHRQTFGHPGAGTVGKGISAPPFYCHSPLRTMVLPGDTSVEINTSLQVLDVFGKVIPSLYAGGVMGHGNLLLRGIGYGIHMAWAFTSGRLSGRNAAAEKPWG